MLKIVNYQPNFREEWNTFIDNAKNGHFMFNRNYMEYHSDRFDDFSLMFFDSNKLLAVLPASIKENTIVSHGGLTFGGIISSPQMSTNKMIEIFEVLINYLKKDNIHSLIYKSVPIIYHTMPSAEDLYALSKLSFAR